MFAWNLDEHHKVDHPCESEEWDFDVYTSNDFEYENVNHTEICMVAVATLSPGFGLSLLELLSLTLVAIRVNEYRPNTLVWPIDMLAAFVSPFDVNHTIAPSEEIDETEIS